MAPRAVCFDRVQPDREQVRRLLGLRAGHANHRRWFETLDTLERELPRIMRPRGVYRIDRVVAREPQRLELASGAVFTGTVGTFLRHAQFVAAWVVTIGSATERLGRGWLRRGQVMQGTVADALASEAAEATAARLQDEVRAWALAHGLEITPRYSPGYCGLTVQQQVPLFASLPVGRINVRLTPSCLMLPLKSVSGLIGLGAPDRVSPAAYSCETCDHPSCVQRRAPFDRGRAEHP